MTANYTIAPPATSENIFFDLKLTAEFWDKPPILDILVDGELIGNYIIDQPTYHIRFKRIMTFDQPHVLELRRSGKTDAQTRRLEDGSFESQNLQIQEVKLDNINLRNLVWHTCTFEPEYPEPWATEQRAQGIELESVVPGEMFLGHNGVWRFKFTSPVYKFLVDWGKGIR